MKKRAGASGWIGVAYDGAQVPVTDTRATKWMNTRTYDTLNCKPPNKYLENASLRIPKGADVCNIDIGSSRRKTKKKRRVTRRKRV